MFGSMGLAVVLMYYKPDTRCVHLMDVYDCDILTNVRSIQTWALKEAKARMEARGENVEYKPS